MRFDNAHIGNTVNSRGVIRGIVAVVDTRLTAAGNCGAAGATITLTVIGFGLVAPAAITVELVQVAVLLPTTVVEQFQPVPVGIAAMVKPAGRLSITVIVPLVFALPGLLAVSV